MEPYPFYKKKIIKKHWSLEKQMNKLVKIGFLLPQI